MTGTRRSGHRDAHRLFERFRKPERHSRLRPPTILRRNDAARACQCAGSASARRVKSSRMIDQASDLQTPVVRRIPYHRRNEMDGKLRQRRECGLGLRGREPTLREKQFLRKLVPCGHGGKENARRRTLASGQERARSESEQQLSSSDESRHAVPQPPSRSRFLDAAQPARRESA